jgi:hypothetical protein
MGDRDEGAGARLFLCVLCSVCGELCAWIDSRVTFLRAASGLRRLGAAFA